MRRKGSESQSEEEPLTAHFFSKVEKTYSHLLAKHFAPVNISEFHLCFYPTTHPKTDLWPFPLSHSHSHYSVEGENH